MVRIEAERATTRDMRRRNRSTLLSELFFRGPLSRHDLSRITGLSAATASSVTAELLHEGIIIEAGQIESDGGRPRVLLRVNPGFGRLVGADVGETGVKVELFDLSMSRLATVDEPLPSSRPDPSAVAGQLEAGIREVLAGVDPDTVLGIGIGVPGTVEQSDPPLVYAPTLGWRGVSFTDLLRERGITAPLFFENGAKTQGQAEMWFGAGRGAGNAVIVLVGSGVGAAVITNGTVYRGASSSAGEWGHTTVVYGGRQCRCGARGCLEAYVGAEGILERYRAIDPTRPAADGEIADVTALVAADTPAAAETLAETAGILGAGIGNLVNLFNPERVVLGGWAGLALGARVLPQIRAAAQEQALEHPFGQVTIELCELGPDAVAFGAATLPMAELLRRASRP
ncbi:ROK family transcriptional regulator [Dactylosporangium darangshiense]|uniref:ROK family transcriptional regulator n=1 Tax=Dactylosporangium darangshiense TaxID=579108 RepID=A0ABP8DBH1_9ACTN